MERVSISVIRSIIDQSPDLSESIQSFEAGETILVEGKANHTLFLIIEGEVGLRKNEADASEEPKRFWIERLSEGAFLGLNSFWTRQPALANSIAITPTRCLAIDRPSFDNLLERHPEFGKDMYLLFADSLSSRYRRMVEMRVELQEMGAALTEERNRLKQALEELESTQAQMLNRERLATLGELLGGIAHEINNPLASLLSNGSALEGLARSLCARSGMEAHFDAGLASRYLSNQEKRLRLESVSEQAPELPRSLARRVSLMPEALRIEALKTYPDMEAMSLMLDAFELGTCLRTQTLSSSRIEKLVGSLRRFGRPYESVNLPLNLTDGINDTVSILENRLKRYELNVEIPENLPQLRGNEGELNQIWTNLLVNAMDATPEGGTLRIGVSVEESTIQTAFEDSGSGIEPENLERIFETNFTTKKRGGSFGLGLGLSISKQIVEAHGGTIRAENRASGGARFVVTLPIG